MKWLTELDEFMDENDLTMNDYCITSGLSLYKLGIKEDYNDIDIIVRNDTFETLKNKYGASKNNPNLIQIKNGDTYFLDILNDKYSILGLSNDEILDRYFIEIDGRNIVRPEITLALRNQELPNRKALKDVEMLGSYAIENELLWDWSLVGDRIDSFKETNKAFRDYLYIYKHKAYLIKRKLIGYLNIKSDIYKIEEFVDQKARKQRLLVGCDLYTALQPENVLANQFYKGHFDGYDILIRYKVVEELERNVDSFFWRDIYLRMQTARGYSETHNLDSFSKLICEIKNGGMHINQAISIDRNNFLYDGSHRLACALFFEEKMLGVKRVNARFKGRNYSLDWFSKNGFSVSEVHAINEEKNNFLGACGIFYPVIIWPPAVKYVETIRNLIQSENIQIVNEEKLAFNGMDELKAFTKGIYSSDDIDLWKVARKTAFFEKYNQEVYIFWAYLNKPAFRKKVDTDNYISTKVECVKKIIRQSVKDSITNYIYDVAVHIGDNYQQNRIMNKYILKYRNDVK